MVTTGRYKAGWEQELKRRAYHGIIDLPEPLPHPDDIIVDFRRNTASIPSPMDKRELADLDLWLTRKNDNEVELQYFAENKSEPKYAQYLNQLECDIAHAKRILEIINTALSLRASPDCIERRLSQLNLKTPDYLVKLAKLEQARSDLNFASRPISRLLIRFDKTL